MDSEGPESSVHTGRASAPNDCMTFDSNWQILSSLRRIFTISHRFPSLWWRLSGTSFSFVGYILDNNIDDINKWDVGPERAGHHHEHRRAANYDFANGHLVKIHCSRGMLRVFTAVFYPHSEAYDKVQRILWLVAFIKLLYRYNFMGLSLFWTPTWLTNTVPSPKVGTQLVAGQCRA